jgi:hypothetical protein
MWLNHEGALAEAITGQLGLSEPSDEVRFYAQFALQIQLHASRSEDPEATIRAGFRLLDPGWNEYLSDLP